MQPQIASHMHNTLALNIDFTFKRVDGTMNEWEVAGMTDRFNRRTSSPLSLNHSFVTSIIDRTYIRESIL